MKLLVLTQKIDCNDDVLGFMHGWVSEFAKRCECVTVVALGVGKYDFPPNVKVLSLGKEKYFGHSSIICRIASLFRFYKYILAERGNYDAVFAHMNPEYIILGGVLWKIWKKRIGLWYAHGHAPFNLKIAEKLTDLIFTSTKSGCRLKSDKINVVGQGIDINNFVADEKGRDENKIFKIISVGRISPSKNYETLIAAAEILVKNNFQFQVDIIGGAGVPEQERYLEDLKKVVREKFLSEKIKFLGPVPNKDILNFLQTADLFVNMSHTGSLDKAVLEAMASGIPVLTCNEAFEEILGNYKKVLMYPKKDYEQLADKIKFIIKSLPEERRAIGIDLRNIVVNNHSSERLIYKIMALYNKSL